MRAGSGRADGGREAVGIIAYHASWVHATGHFDLWTGRDFVGEGNFEDIEDGYAIEMWFVS